MISTVTPKRKLLFFIPFGVVIATLLFSWYSFIFTANIAGFQHYLGLVLMLPVLYFLFRDKTFKKVIVLTGVYLILATINLLSFLPFISSSSFGVRIGSMEIFSPGLNGFSLLLLVVYFVMNFYTLADIHLDYKEIKGKL